MSTSGDSSSFDKSNLIDWQKVALPSDQITLGQIRRLVRNNPARFDTVLHNLIAMERELIYASLITLGRNRPREGQHVSSILVDEASETLREMYVRVGLAAGKHEATELVNGLLAAVVGASKGRSRRGR